MSKPTIEEMRTKLVEDEVLYIQEMSSNQLFQYASEKTNFFNNEVYDDDEIETLYMNIFGKLEDKEE